ncbi:hypothetical protein [Solicola sp. PLA-1-18]|uniref:hypothetical protein n=1 Tax=Solicola sp. PLA-1-18 TaxID=3380532 RepID=UPI003B7CABD9
MPPTAEFVPRASRPVATADDLAEALRLAERELAQLEDVGSWMFVALSKLRLPYWPAERRAFVLEGLIIEPFAHRVDAGTWRWAEPAAHGEVEVPERPRARTTAEVLARIEPADHATVLEVLDASAQDEDVRRTELRAVETDGTVVPVVMLTRGCRPCPAGDVDVVVGYAMAGPS